MSITATFIERIGFIYKSSIKSSINIVNRNEI